MSTEHLDILHSNLPELFEDKCLPSGWDDEWIIIGEGELDLGSEDLYVDSEELNGDSEARLPTVSDIYYPPISGDHPGALVPVETVYPPPDAYAFYLPIHYYHPVWWGVYVIFEGLLKFVEKMDGVSNKEIDRPDLFNICRDFLHSHETYHHKVECLSIRWELSHRTPLYKTFFTELYRKDDVSDCAAAKCSCEEALANAYAFNRVVGKYKNHEKLETIKKALLAYIDKMDDCYSFAGEIIRNNIFIESQNIFAERNCVHALKHIPIDPEVWHCFPHAFTGISRANSPVNYLIHKDSPISRRKKLYLKHFQYSQLRKKLKKYAECRFIRQGKGSHEIWVNPFGKEFPVPRHLGDYKKGLLSAIIKQAGLNMSVKQFLAL